MIRWLALLIAALALTLWSARHPPVDPETIAGPRQWEVHELTFIADREYADPFDIENIRFSALFRGPAGEELVLPGFWDGGRTWKIRFTPTAPGRWQFRTACMNTADTGLHGRMGALLARPHGDRNALTIHGGFLKVSANKRFLTYTDGTPFFWLADTWWRAPSSTVPLVNFRQMVAVRTAQRFTVYQAHGFRSFSREGGPTAFEAVRPPREAALRYWRTTDRYIAHAAAQGLVGVMGFAGGSLLDPISLDELKRLWWYYVARYGAYPITFLFTQEYNKNSGNRDDRVAKMLQLGRFVKAIDPYERAMSIHPWHRAHDTRDAWSASWLDFIMLQSGHFRRERCAGYLEVYDRVPRKPFLESETNYEGFARPGFTVDASAVRNSAYTAIQCGSLGFSYGAQGLYAGIGDANAPGPTSRWGPVLTWYEGLRLPGGSQMRHVRTCYESVEWWRLEPRALSRDDAGVLVQADGDKTFVIYYARAGRNHRLAGLEIPSGEGTYRGAWCDPRSGRRTRVELSASARTLTLPAPPSSDDWLLVLDRR